MLPLCASAQQAINRSIAGLTLGRRYTVAQAERAIEQKNNTFTRVNRESSSNIIMSLGSVQFAGEGWNHMFAVLESTGRVATICFERRFKDINDADAFYINMAKAIISKYGAPSVDSKDLSVESIWEDNRHTQLRLEVTPTSDAAEIIVYLSYEDPRLMEKIQKDIIEEL